MLKVVLDVCWSPWGCGEDVCGDVVVILVMIFVVIVDGVVMRYGDIRVRPLDGRTKSSMWTVLISDKVVETEWLPWIEHCSRKLRHGSYDGLDRQFCEEGERSCPYVNRKTGFSSKEARHVRRMAPGSSIMESTTVERLILSFQIMGFVCVVLSRLWPNRNRVRSL